MYVQYNALYNIQIGHYILQRKFLHERYSIKPAQFSFTVLFPAISLSVDSTGVSKTICFLTFVSTMVVCLLKKLLCIHVTNIAGFRISLENKNPKALSDRQYIGFHLLNNPFSEFFVIISFSRFGKYYCMAGLDRKQTLTWMDPPPIPPSCKNWIGKEISLPVIKQRNSIVSRNIFFKVI